MSKPLVKTIHSQPSWILRSRNVELAVTQRGGHMAPVTFYRNGAKPVQPYYISPWQDEELTIYDPVLVPLRGDFFCAPFGANAQAVRGEQHRCHGEPAWAKWRFVRQEQIGKVASITLAMRTKVRPGKITKTLQLLDGQNVVYSRDVLEGYRGAMPMGHHATLAMPATEGALRVSTSAFALGTTYPGVFSDPAEGAYQALAIGKRFRDLRSVPVRFNDAPPADCTRFPARTGYTDLLAVHKKPGDAPAWTTAVNTEAGYLWFSLKDPAILPATVFWIANQGRHQEPWAGRNRCLGLEDVCSYFADGLGPSTRANTIAKAGFPTAIRLSPKAPTSIHYIQGVVRVPKGFGRVKDVTFERRRVIFRDGKKSVSAPVRWSFLKTGEL